MKTTIELPGTTFLLAKTLAAGRGMTLKRFFTEALEGQLRRFVQVNPGSVNQRHPGWPGLVGSPTCLTKTAASWLLSNRNLKSFLPTISLVLDPNALSAWAEGLVLETSPGT